MLQRCVGFARESTLQSNPWRASFAAVASKEGSREVLQFSRLHVCRWVEGLQHSRRLLKNREE